MKNWVIRFNKIKSEKNGLRESLCTLGNGYFAIRGATEEAKADNSNYPGTYMAGLYNALESQVDGHQVNHEDLVNCPNTLMIDCYPLALKKIWAKSNRVTKFKLNLLEGVLERSTEVCDYKGRKTLIKTKRLVSMHNPHTAALQYTITPLNWSNEFIIVSGIDAEVTNSGVKRYQELNNQHLNLITLEFIDDNLLYLSMETRISKIQLHLSARNTLQLDNKQLMIKAKKCLNHKSISHQYKVHLKKGQSLKLDKIISIYNSKDYCIKNLKNSTIDTEKNSNSFKRIYSEHKKTWADLWKQSQLDLSVSTNELRILRLHFFHIMQTLSPHSIGLDCGVPARGLHGEAYRGHVFWDELFILPFLSPSFPEITRSLLLYRYRRLNKARELAKNAGFKGAMYPWQSASDGDETSQIWHLNPITQRWGRDHSSVQRHVNCAIAYNIWHYYQTTHDRNFLVSYGAIMFIEITRLLVSLCSFNEKLGLYEIKYVIGPDEYHEKYPSKNKIGINNNAYTNIMTVWVINKAQEIIDTLSHRERETLSLSKTEIKLWSKITRRIFIPFHEGVISQFQGYESLKEFEWEQYREKYGNIERLDRILKLENDTTNNYKVSKQADVAMLFYLIPKQELKDIFNKLNLDLSDMIIKKTINYYLDRCSHGSTLSKMVYADVLGEFDRKRAKKLYQEALMSDYLDTQQGTTQEGIHLGLMTGTLLINRKDRVSVYSS